MSRANPGRVAAVRVLIGVEDGGHAEDLLASHAPKSGPDRALAWHLALGALRWQGSIDHALRPLVARGLERLDPAVRCALRVGLFEATQSRTPARAAVHQAVETTKVLGMRRASGVVNAVLRKACSSPLSEDPRHTLPAWLLERWSSHQEWLNRIRQPAKVSISGRLPEGVDAEPAILHGVAVPDLWTLSSSAGQVSELPGFDEGAFWVMDPAAARVADLVVEELDGSGTVLDACAAPGGKAFRLTSRGLRVTAVDQSEARLVRMSENLQRLGRTTPMVAHDWTTGPLQGAELFDAVLVDAPCTALGVVRRHPEILWRRQPGDIAAMAVVQRVILRHAASHVKPGGVLIYAVCSTEPEEGAGVASSLEGWTVTKHWSSVPPEGDEDGFQAFTLRRTVD